MASPNEELFINYSESINETLDKVVKFAAMSKYCRSVDYVNNPDLKDFVVFVDNLHVSSNYSLISCLNKIIDKKGVSVFTLIEFIKTYPCLFGGKKEESILKIRKVEGDISEYETLISNLRSHRNEFHSHLSEKVAGSDDMYYVFTRIKIDEKEFESFLHTLCQAIKDISLIFKVANVSLYIERYIEDMDSLYELMELSQAFSKLMNKEQEGRVED